MNRFGRLAGWLAASALLTSAATIVPSTSAHAATWSWERTLKDSRVVESSGLARSTWFGDRLFTHNDSGDSTRIFAINRDGSTASTITVNGASAVDWEDISNGPGHTLWIGDIGDNGGSRTSIQLYKIAEPKYLSSSMTVTATRYTFAYPDGRHDAEGLMVSPVTGRVYIVSKKTYSGAAVYEAPSTLSTSGTNVLRRVTGAPAQVTGAAFAPSGNGFVLADYSRAHFYRGFGSAPVVLSKPSLRQGESVEVTAAGRYIQVGSEGSQSPVYAAAVPAGAW